MKEDRDNFMNRIDARDNKLNKQKYDVAAYPFGAEELLLNQEFIELEKEERE